MQLDKDGIITILLGIALVLAAWLAEFYLFAGQSALQATINIIKDIVLGGIAGVGLLLIVVGILFITAW